MIKRLLHIISLSMVFCLLFTGCSAAGTGGGSSTGEAQSTVPVQENTETSGLPEEGESAVSEYTYKTSLHITLFQTHVRHSLL